MKKIFIISTIILTSLAANAIDDSRPVFEKMYPKARFEYKPANLLNMTQPEISSWLQSEALIPYCKSDKKWVQVARNITILPAIGCFEADIMRTCRVSDHNYKVKYWINKKEQFEKDLKVCDGLPKENRTRCYEEFKIKEMQKKEKMPSIWRTSGTNKIILSN